MNKNKIEEFLINYFIQKEGAGVKKILFKTNLLETGMLDSLDLVTLSIQIEKKFKIKINPNSSETLKNFKDIKKIINYIYSKKKNK